VVVMATSDLLQKVKQNLIIEHSEDDGLIESYITAAVSYAESYPACFRRILFIS
jgi:hypothetical protein